MKEEILQKVWYCRTCLRVYWELSFKCEIDLTYNYNKEVKVRPSINGGDNLMDNSTGTSQKLKHNGQDVTVIDHTCSTGQFWISQCCGIRTSKQKKRNKLCSSSLRGSQPGWCSPKDVFLLSIAAVTLYGQYFERNGNTVLNVVGE